MEIQVEDSRTWVFGALLAPYKDPEPFTSTIEALYALDND